MINGVSLTFENAELFFQSGDPFLKEQDRRVFRAELVDDEIERLLEVANGDFTADATVC